MKKPFIFLLLLFGAQNTFCQNTNPELLTSVLEELQIPQEKCFMTLVSSLEIPNDETILVIPEIEEAGEGYAVLNSYILVVNSTNGTIKSSFYKQKAWYTDAVRIYTININYQPFLLNSISESFGITISYGGNSRVNPLEFNELSLYERKEQEIKLLLKNFPIYYFTGENDGMSNGKYEEHQKSIEPSSVLTNGYFDLEVKDSVTNYQFIDGEEKNIIKRLETEILKFENGEYRKTKD